MPEARVRLLQMQRNRTVNLRANLPATQECLQLIPLAGPDYVEMKRVIPIGLDLG